MARKWASPEQVLLAMGATRSSQFAILLDLYALAMSENDTPYPRNGRMLAQLPNVHLDSLLVSIIGGICLARTRFTL